MNKKIIPLAISSAIVFNNVHTIQSVYADNNIQSNQSIENKDKKTNNVVYLTNGEGSLNGGNGTTGNPYTNIRTALEKVPDGGTIKLIGTVKYTRYEEHTDKSALPLFINKNITIEGGSNVSPTSSNQDGIYSRVPIQLGANVTFRNIHLEIANQVTLGRNTNEQNNRMLGTPIPRSATIFAAGHELTLDNINTKIGTNPDETSVAPYISGGSYKNQGKIGPKAVINIINPNSETKFSEVYAGDYWEERNFDVDININATVLAGKIYTGGLKPLNGNVNITLNDKAASSIDIFDKKNLNGDVNLTIKDFKYLISNINFNGVNNLTLEDDISLELAKNSSFNVNNVTLKNGSRIDFREIIGNPVVMSIFSFYLIGGA